MKTQKTLVLLGAAAMLLGVPGCRITVEDFCGDGFLDPDEECDDGNNRNGDGCDASCFLELCGDTVLDPGEECDDGNNFNGDGCSANCLIEGFCGDGILDSDEECDDGNNTDGDGCTGNCFVELTDTQYLSCDNSDMCAPPDQCIEIDLPMAGTFGAMCTSGCLNDGECPGANANIGRCYEIEGATALCYQQCAANSECYTGSTCIDLTLPGGVLDSVCAPNN